jgi:RNA polymerase sigma-70 factor, ECF subfamily
VNVFGVSNETELAELVRRIIGGDARAEEEIVRRYKDGVSIIIGKIIQRPSVTEDIFQETFKKALEKIRHGDVREPERLSGFICSMARNLAIEHVRKERKVTKEAEIGRTEQIPDPAPDQFEQLWRKERAEIVRQVLNELKVKRDRDVILRYYIAEEDKDQICADLGLTRGQFNGVIFRALKRYKELYVKLVGNS